MKAYIKGGNTPQTMCISDASTVLITDPNGSPLVLIQGKDGSKSTAVQTIDTGEREFLDAVEAAGFTVGAMS